MGGGRAVGHSRQTDVDYDNVRNRTQGCWIKSAFRTRLRLIEIKRGALRHNINRSVYCSSRPPQSRAEMQKIALKMLLTGLIARRGSKRINAAQLTASLLMLVVLLFVGLYIWSHGAY
jgi:hypothetical protein